MPLDNIQQVVKMFESGKKIIPLIKESNLIFYIVVDDSDNFSNAWDLFLNGLMEEKLSFQFKIIEEKSEFIITIKEFSYVLLTKAYNIISPSSFSLQSLGNIRFNKIAISLTDNESEMTAVGREIDLWFNPTLRD